MTTALVVLLAFNFVALSWWLLRQGQKETRLDLGTVAEKMAADILREYAYDGVILEETGTKGYLSTKYIRLVSLYGLPIKGRNRAVSVAWGLIQEAQSHPVADVRKFSFYE